MTSTVSPTGMTSDSSYERADEGGGSGLQQRGLLDVPSGDGKHDAEARDRRDDEREQLEGQSELKGRDTRGHTRAYRDEAKREREGDQLGDPEHSCHDQPDDPCHHEIG